MFRNNYQRNIRTLLLPADGLVYTWLYEAPIDTITGDYALLVHSAISMSIVYYQQQAIQTPHQQDFELPGSADTSADYLAPNDRERDRERTYDMMGMPASMAAGSSLPNLGMYGWAGGLEHGHQS